MQLSAQFHAALAYAAALHADQTRKSSGEPYLVHLLTVTALVMEYDGTEEEAIAALLHDAVEDQGGTVILDEIQHRFGSTVADIVEGCTDAFTRPKPPWRPRKEAYVTHLTAASASVRRVAAADKLHNVRSILREYRRHGESLWDCFRGGREGTLWYYRAVVESLQSAGNNPLVEELARTVAELERLTASKTDDPNLAS